jgi:hypothetical protein
MHEVVSRAALLLDHTSMVFSRLMNRVCYRPLLDDMGGCLPPGFLVILSAAARRGPAATAAYPALL